MVLFHLFSSEDLVLLAEPHQGFNDFRQDRFLAMPFLVSKNHAKNNTFLGVSSHLVQITTAGEALQILRLGSRPWFVTRIHLQLVKCPPNLGRIGKQCSNL